MTNAGVRAVEWLFRDQLQVDAEWSIRTPTGFRWWADQNAQTVEVIGEETAPDGEKAYLISVRTELLRSLDLGVREAMLTNVLLMPFASMCGPVYDRQTRTLSLASLVRVHDGNSQWMNPLIGVAAVLQIGEARILGPELAMAFQAEEALSGPPGRGLRPQPDEMAEVIATLIAPMGTQPSPWLPPSSSRRWMNTCRGLQHCSRLPAERGSPLSFRTVRSPRFAKFWLIHRILVTATACLYCSQFL